MQNNLNNQVLDMPPAVTVGALNLIRALGRGDFPVIAATSLTNKTVFYSRFQDKSYEIKGPTKTPLEFVKALITIGKELAPSMPVLFYNGDADLLCISRNRNKLDNYYRFNMPTPDVIEALVDKSLFIDYAEQFELPIPTAKLVGLDKEINNSITKQFTLPVIVKPISRVDWFDTPLARAFSKGGKVILVDSRKELDSIISISKEHNVGIIIQEHVQGDESLIVSYHSYVDKKGNILGEYTGRKYRTFPNRFGMSTCVEVCNLPDVLLAGRNIIEKTGLIGVSKLDFKRDPVSGKLYLLEINPRFNLWNYPGAVAGVNLPLIAYNNITGNNLQFNSQIKRNIRWVDGARDRLAYKESGRALAFYFESLFRNYFRRTVYNVWSLDDPVPFFWVILKRLSHLFKKSLQKLTSRLANFYENR
jgi:D-aspartate ligase